MMHVILQGRPPSIRSICHDRSRPKPHGHVLTKNIDQEEQNIVFQYWIEKSEP